MFNFYLIQEEAKALYTAVLEFLPDVETFQNEVLKAKPLQDCQEAHQQAVLKQLLALLQTLHSKISQMKSDMYCLRGDLRKTAHFTYENNLSISPPVLKIESAEDDRENHLENFDGSRSGFGGEQKNLVESNSASDAAIKPMKFLNNLPPSSSQMRAMKTHRVKCHICGEKINNSRSSHMQKYHPGKKNFPCKTCGMAFDDFKEFHNHAQTHVVTPSFRCDLCNMALKTRIGMIQHMMRHKGEKPHTCGVCGKSFKFKGLLTTCTHTHVTQAVFDITKYQFGFRCKLCGERFASLEAMTRSISKKHSPEETVESLTKLEKEKNPCVHNETQKIYFCNFCPKAFALVRRLRDHIKFHNGVEVCKCNICGEKFYSYRAKKKHMYEKHASGEFPGYKCKICGEMCRSPLGRDTHYLRHTPEERSIHGVVVKMVDCHICGKTVRRNNLASHKKKHSAKVLFICEVCGKGFKLKNSLDYHVVTHMKPEDRPVLKPRQKRPKVQPGQKLEKIYPCDICSKLFARREYVQAHKKIHTPGAKEKPFKCNECGMSFTQAANLKRHSTIHTGEKPFQCDFCGKGFAQKVTLDIHKRIHTGERPYQCNYCGKSFSDPSTLYKHKAKHEKDNFSDLNTLS